MRVVITRPRGQAGGLAGALAAANIEVMAEPLLEIVPRRDVAPRLDGVQALLVTSANGIRALAAATDRRDLAVFAVGDRTAAVAGERGFGAVRSAGGAVDDLAALAAANLDPAGGRLVHAAGADTAGDLAGALAKHGFTVDRVVLYDARPVDRLSADLRAALAAGSVDGMVFFSPRTAAVFAKLTGARRDRLDRVTAFCLSANVAAAVADLGWADMVICDRPTEPQMVTAILAAKAGLIDRDNRGTRPTDG